MKGFASHKTSDISLIEQYYNNKLLYKTSDISLLIGSAIMTSLLAVRTAVI